MKWKQTGQFEDPPPGSHIARCISLIDLGTQTHPGWQGEEPWSSRDVRIGFELPLKLMAGLYKPELKGRPFGVSTTMKQSLHPSAKMRRFLASWAGRKLTKEDMEKFDPRKLLGQPCRLTLIQSEDYLNIDGIAPLGEGEKCPPQVNKSTYLSLDPDEFDLEAFKRLPPRLQEKIATSPEMKVILGEEPEPVQEEVQQQTENDSGRDDQGCPFRSPLPQTMQQRMAGFRMAGSFDKRA